MNPAKRIMDQLKEQGNDVTVTEYVERCPHCEKIIYADVQWQVKTKEA